MKNELLMLIDGNSLVYRAFFALPLLRTKKGAFTNAIYGFLTMLFRVLKDFEPEYLVVAFDKSRVTLRTQDFADYKAHRQPTPPELREQFTMLKEILAALDITIWELDGYEADDLIGSLACHGREAGIPVVIVTGDQDALQLTGRGVDVVLCRKGITETEKYSDELVMEKWEVYPHQLVDIKGLMGDASDNIPGVPGIGKKTAIKLIKEYGSLDELYRRIEEVAPARIQALLKDNREQAFLSRSLGTIMTNIDIPFNTDDFRYSNPDKSKLLEIYQELEFNSFVRELGTLEEPSEIIEVQDFALVLDQIQGGDELSIYLVTSHHHPMWAEINETYICWRGGSYVLKGSETLRMKEILEDPWISKYLHNAKTAQVLWSRQGIDMKGLEGDTLLLSYVIDPSFEGESLQEHLFHYWGRVVEECNAPAKAAAEIMNFHQYLMEKAGPELKELYRHVELPLSRILADMELAGVKVDGITLAAISTEMGQRIEMAEKNIFELAGEQFNINSTRQLGQILYEKLGLPILKKTKTGASTNAEVLEQLYDKHPIIPSIMDYRQMVKLKSTYVDALQNYIHPQTGRIHTIFKQAVTATGRLSSVEPNLQNIPIRMEDGRRIRKAFTAESGNLLLSADYSQIDLRVLAHVSEDEILIDTFKAGVDIHTRTASEIFRVPLDSVTSELRRRAKAVNFGIVYGISDFGLARDTGVTRIEARQYIASYLDSYPGVRRYMHDIVENGRDQGYVATILGRRRYLPDLLSSNRMVRSFAERMALNTPIQGSSADIIKLAMLLVDEKLRQQKLQSRMLLQVHDELVFEVNRDELDILAKLVKESMEEAYQLKVPLEVSVKVGNNWYEMKNWE